MLDKEIIFCGDTFFKDKVNLPKFNSNYIFNLEAPITNSNSPINDKVNLKISTDLFLSTFSDNKPYAVNLSNNHIFDFGIQGINDTISVLDNLGIRYFGLKNNRSDSALIIEDKIVVLSYCCKSTHPAFNMGKNLIHEIDLNQIQKDIDNYKNKGYYIVLQFHWGDEEIFFPKPDDIKIARESIDMGADLIIGHHAHVIQSCENYKGKNIFYGIGNFIFPHLNEPSFFDGYTFKKTYFKQQFISNRKSLAIKLKKDLKTSIKYYIYDANLNIVNNSKASMFFLNLLPKNRFYYKVLYYLSLRYKMVKIFLHNPKKISIKRIKQFLGF